MAVLWFVLADSMYGYPAYNSAISDIIRMLEGQASFRFLCRLDQAPSRAREHDQAHVASYNRVLLELALEEARSVGWRAGFYEVCRTPKDIFAILGEPNVPTKTAGSP